MLFYNCIAPGPFYWAQLVGKRSNVPVVKLDTNRYDFYIPDLNFLKCGLPKSAADSCHRARKVEP